MTGIDGSGTAGARCYLAPNPSPMTLDGTNTWVIGDVVIDPGPEDEGHLRRIAERHRVREVLLTHGHLDHSAGARRFSELTGAPVRALDPRHRLGAEGLGEGDVVAAGDMEIRVLATPGHSSDSLCFWLPADRALLTGDSILGRGTTVIAPDGDLADYLRTLDRLQDLAEEFAILLPGHGPVVESPVETIRDYVAHRRTRLDQIAEAQRHGARTPQEIVEIVYRDVDPSLWPAAEMSVRAQLRYLSERGRAGAPDPES